MMVDENRLRLTILGGFLGAGKSTWLRHQLFVKTYGQPHVVVNEVADHAVDDTLLAGALQLDVLAGGCVCCDQRKQMISLLHRICNDRSRDQDNPALQHLVFEMSGVADPGQVLSAIQSDPILARHILLKEIVVVVDALHGVEQLRTEKLARLQIEAADQILITKTDICDAQTLGTLLATLRQINPSPEFRACSFGVEVPMPNFTSAQPIKLQELSDNAQSSLSSLPINLDDYDHDGGNWVGFSVWLSAMLHTHGDRLVRVKGVVRTPTGRLLLQSVRKVMQAPEILPDTSVEKKRTSDNTIVLIGHDLDPKLIKASLDNVMVKSKN